jgi:hypothetical protein
MLFKGFKDILITFFHIRDAQEVEIAYLTLTNICNLADTFKNKLSFRFKRPITENVLFLVKLVRNISGRERFLRGVENFRHCLRFSIVFFIVPGFPWIFHGFGE